MSNSTDSSILVLRTVSENMTSYNDFVWPKSGYVEAKDWEPTYECGNGLHGLLWGEGYGGYLDWSDEAIWLVVNVLEKDLLTGDGDLKDKCKFQCGGVVFCGVREEAINYLVQNGGLGKAIVGLNISVGNNGTATAGNNGKATAGYNGKATAGDDGTATAGNYGTATAGNDGKATAGDGGKATAGNYGILIFSYWCYKTNRKRIKTYYVGEDGVKANVLYKLKNGQIVEN